MNLKANEANLGVWKNKEAQTLGSLGCRVFRDIRFF
jgi:hypothetical protein